MAKTRYSDSELKEFQELIIVKLATAQEDLDLLKGSLSHNDDHGTNDTGRTFNMMEDGSETLSREEVAQQAARQEKFIVNATARYLTPKLKTLDCKNVNPL